METILVILAQPVIHSRETSIHNFHCSDVRHNILEPRLQEVIDRNQFTDIQVLLSFYLQNTEELDLGKKSIPARLWQSFAQNLWDLQGKPARSLQRDRLYVRGLPFHWISEFNVSPTRCGY